MRAAEAELWMTQVVADIPGLVLELARCRVLGWL